MLSKFRVQHYKSLFDTEVTLEPLTVFIGPNGSGKSNVCEAIGVAYHLLKHLSFDPEGLTVDRVQQGFKSKFWHGELTRISFEVCGSRVEDQSFDQFSLLISIHYADGDVTADTLPKLGAPITNKRSNEEKSFLRSAEYRYSSIAHALSKVCVYNFSSESLANESSHLTEMDATGKGLVDSLVNILLTNRKKFDELEGRLSYLAPNIQRIALPRGDDQVFSLELIDRYSENPIPALDVSGGTLRLLAFLAALYQDSTPSIICFEEPENGIHPWLLNKIMELLKIISTDGITGKPVQIIITTHSPVLLNYVEPHQVRAVELDDEGKTQVHSLPTDSVRFQKALEAYDGSLGELWFTNVFGGNPV
jgi:predicted ATPase